MCIYLESNTIIYTEYGILYCTFGSSPSTRSCEKRLLSAMNQWSTVDLERHFLLLNSNCLLGKGVFKDLYVQAPERTTEDQENTPLPVILLIMKSAQFSVLTVALKIEETAKVGKCRDSMHGIIQDVLGLQAFTFGTLGVSCAQTRQPPNSAWANTLLIRSPRNTVFPVSVLGHHMTSHWSIEIIFHAYPRLAIRPV